jgi:photosystem II stability/assembly factor-like uncharacterized protein
VSAYFNLTIAGSLIAMALVGASPAWGEPDVLERPALQSWRAKNSAMLAVTRAGNRIVAVGERGIVLLSDDSGSTWRQAAVPVSVSLTNVKFVTNQTGWAVGHSGVVLRSTDGGLSWKTQLDGKKAAELLLESAKQYVERNPNDSKAKQLVTDAERAVADGPDKPFLDLWFRNETEGFIVGAYGLILGTTDGGQTWHSWQDRLDNPKGLHLYSIDVAGNDVYIAGEQGTLFHSTDSGRSFSAVKTPYEGTYFGVRHLAGGGALAFGLRGNIYRSADGVRAWTKVANDYDATLNAAGFLDDGSVVLVGQSGRVFRSKDEGRSFQTVPGGRQPFPLTGVVQAPDASMVLAGMGGVAKVTTSSLEPGAKR